MHIHVYIYIYTVYIYIRVTERETIKSKFVLDRMMASPGVRQLVWLPQQNYCSRAEADRCRAPDRQPPPTTKCSEHTNIKTSY